MKYKVAVSGVQLILNETQLAILLTAVQDAYQIIDKHVGNHKGTQGYNNAYVPAIEVRQPHDWLGVTLVADDFVDATLLAMKLSKDEE